MAVFSRRQPSSQRVHSHRDQTPWYMTLVTTVIFSLVGWLFFINVDSNSSYDPSTNTEGLLAKRGQTVNALTNDVKSLTNQIDVLKKNLASDVNASSEANANSNSTQTVLPALQGPGVTVTLNDSPLWSQHVRGNAGTTDNANDYVVHQQDIEAVVNALWAGGAEAMTIQGQRVNASTSVRCVGNVLLIEGKQFAPPYTISAIGDPDQLMVSLNSSPAIRTYLEYVEADGLGYSAKKVKSLRFAKTSMTTQTLKYASTVGNKGE